MSLTRIGRVGVLAGGPSNEREISLRSGRAVHASLVRKGLDAVLLDVRNDIKSVIEENKIDIAFIALHGRFGEDGTVQRILEDMKIPYTGSRPEASKTALDKVLTKSVFERSEIPSPRYIIFEKDDFNPEDCYHLGFPMVVKPHLEGSSIGLSVVNDKNALVAAIDKAFEYGELALIEEYVAGRELTVGILDDEPLPVIEIVTKDNIYDYKAKYADLETKYLVPAPLDEETAKRAQALGKSSHLALGCRCFSRIDMIMDSSSRFFVLEANTIPGMTERSLLPKAAQAIGLSFDDLCIRLVENALIA
ncbi:MAG: D-alanine--D-alanine ligase [Candidatus Omnitrophica bacterium]|nr:D-alanine--D-alanine ligase [Candidatus Omnitrophota bacterium]